MRRRIIPWVGVLFLFVGCAQRHEPVIARVGKLTVTDSEFQRKLTEVTPQYQNYVLTPNGRRQFLDILIREKMILAAATDSGIEGAPEFKSQWDKLQADEVARLAEAKDYLMTQLWLADLHKRGILSVSDEEVRQYYNQHPKEVQVRHILLATAEEAEGTLKNVRAEGRFAETAKAKSLDADTATDGGRMQPAIYGEIIPELEDVVFRSKVGEVVGPVRSKFGYHVLRKESEKTVPLSQIEGRILRVLEKQKLDDYLKSMQSKYPVEVMDAKFN